MALTDYKAAASEIGRKPVEYVQLILDKCKLVYGTAPCTASGALENLFIGGSDYTSSSFSKDDFLIGTVPDPDNEFGDVYRCQATHASPAIYQNVPIMLGQLYTLSVYVRAGGGAMPVMRLTFTDCEVDIRMDSGLSSMTNTCVAGGVAEQISGWRRVYLVFTGASLGGGIFFSFPGAELNSYCYLYGAQVRRGGNLGLLNKSHMAGILGAERLCFNTYNTCQDEGNYDRGSTTYTFITAHQTQEEVNAFPVIQSVKYTPTKITPGLGLSTRAKVTIQFQDFIHNDAGVDPYAQVRRLIASSQGTFFGKLLARNRYYKGRPLRVFEAYENSLADSRRRDYIIDSLSAPDHSGQVRLVAKDYLDLVSNVKAQCPEPVEIKLALDITAGSTTLTFATVSDAAALNIETLGQTHVHIAIDDEIIKLPFTGNDGIRWVGCERGQFETEAQAHRKEQNVQPLYSVDGIELWRVMVDLLVRFGKVPASLIPSADWEAEYSAHISNFRLTGIVEKPTGIAKLLQEFLALSLSDLWWDELTQKIKWQVQTPYQIPKPTVLNSEEHFLEGSLRLADKPSLQKTRMLTYYGIRNPVKDLVDAENFLFAQFDIQASLESDNAYGQRPIQKLFNRWLRNDDRDSVRLIAARLLQRYGHIAEELSFSLDARHATDLNTGDVFDAEMRLIQNVDGSHKRTRFQVIETMPDKYGSVYRYKALAYFESSALVITPSPEHDSGEPGDTAPPTLAIMLDKYIYLEGDVGVVTFVFDGPVVDFSLQDVVVGAGGLSLLESSDGGITFAAMFTPLAGIYEPVNHIVVNMEMLTDGLGNAGEGVIFSDAYSVNTTGVEDSDLAEDLAELVANSVIQLTIGMNNTELHANEGAIITFTFDQVVRGFTIDDIQIPNTGTLFDFVTSTGITYAVTIAPTDDTYSASNRASVNLSGLEDNLGVPGQGTIYGPNYIVNTTPAPDPAPVTDPDEVVSNSPIQLIISMSQTVILRNGGAYVYFIFDQPVLGFSTADILTIPNGTLSDFRSFDVTDYFIATFTPTDGVHDLSNRISVDLSGMTDAGGVSGQGIVYGPNYTVRTGDSDQPAEPEPAAEFVSFVVAGDNYVNLTNQLTLTPYVAQTTQILDWTPTQVFINGEAAGSGFIFNNVVNGTINFTGYPEGEVLDVGIRFSFTPGQDATSSVGVILDLTQPTIEIEISRTEFGVGDTAQVTFTFSERVLGFSFLDIYAGGGTITAPVSVDGIIYTATFTPIPNFARDENTISVDMRGVRDLAGNPGQSYGPASTGIIHSEVFSIDTLAAVVTPEPGGGGTHSIVANQADFNLFVAIGGPPGEIGTRDNPFVVTIEDGVTITATQGNAAFSLGALAPGCFIKIINRGNIYGHSGVGGDGARINFSTSEFNIPGIGPVCFTGPLFYGTIFASGAGGETGGTALDITGANNFVEIDNSDGHIFAGGAGGNGGHRVRIPVDETLPIEYHVTGSGAGGGQGSDGEAASPGIWVENVQCGEVEPHLIGNPGFAGTVAGAGAGGAPANANASSVAGGGDGYAWGAASHENVRGYAIAPGNNVVIIVAGDASARLKGRVE